MVTIAPEGSPTEIAAASSIAARPASSGTQVTAPLRRRTQTSPAAATWTIGDAVAGGSDAELLEAFAAVEHEAQSPYRPYRAVLAQALGGLVFC